jgi:hypothetical protein
MDKFEALTQEAGVCLAILANPRNGDVQLIDVDAAPLPADVVLRYHVRGLEFAGLLGLVNGQPRVVLEDVLSDALMLSVRLEFLRLYGAAIEQVENSLKGDSALWLERLWRLQ